MAIILGDVETWKKFGTTNPIANSFQGYVSEQNRKEKQSTPETENRKSEIIKQYFIGLFDEDSTKVVRHICDTIRHCRTDKAQAPKIQQYRQAKSGLVQIHAQQPTFQTVTPIPFAVISGQPTVRNQQGQVTFDPIAFDQVKSSVMLAFMRAVYEYDATHTPTISNQLAVKLKDLSVATNEELEELIAISITHFLYELLANNSYAASQTAYSRPDTDPYGWVLICGSFIPSSLLLVPGILTFVLNLQWAVRLALPGAFLVAGYILSQVYSQCVYGGSRNREQDYTQLPAPTEHQLRASIAHHFCCWTTVFNTAFIEALTTVNSYLAIPAEMYVVTPGGAIVAGTVALFIFERLQHYGYITEAPMAPFMRKLADCCAQLRNHVSHCGTGYTSLA